MASLKYFYYDILTEFYSIILATKQSFIPFILMRFVNIWDLTTCTSTECTFSMVCEVAWWWLNEPKHVARFIYW